MWRFNLNILITLIINSSIDHGVQTKKKLDCSIDTTILLTQTVVGSGGEADLDQGAAGRAEEPLVEADDIEIHQRIQPEDNENAENPQYIKGDVLAADLMEHVETKSETRWRLSLLTRSNSIIPEWRMTLRMPARCFVRKPPWQQSRIWKNPR